MLFLSQFSNAVMLLTCSSITLADGPADNHPEKVRPVPPIGIELSDQDRSELNDGLTRLQMKISILKTKSSAEYHRLLPDVEIFERAVRQGVEYRELFSKRDVERTKMVLKEGLKRADSLLAGKSPWTTQTGLVVRGFRSKIDNTVQPYGLVIPDTYRPGGDKKYRVDLWFHGRGERSTEPLFIGERMTKVGRYAPEETIVLHPYGRYSNAFKFAGEVDVLEALAHAREHYRVDDDRVSVRGFSMGGAGCWQMAVHYPDMFFAASPGAGFSETPEFLKSFQQETLNPTWYEKKLWQMYDCPGYTANLYNLPTIAYSGELDIQKQAADVMEQALAKNEQLKLTHIIGRKTKHSIHPESMKIIESKMASLAKKGRTSVPHKIRFATFTLKYNRMHWLTVTGLDEHWKQAVVHAELIPMQNTIRIAAKNVKSFDLNLPAGQSPFDPTKPIEIQVQRFLPDRSTTTMDIVTADQPATDRSWSASLFRDRGTWKIGVLAPLTLEKRSGLQGPIDDAFMDAFTVVQPTGTSSSSVDQWAKSEMEHFVKEWRRHFRGDVVIKKDTEITKDDIANRNLILFGDPSSNGVIARIAGQLPIGWKDGKVVVGDKSYDAKHHAPILIYPNPLNPGRYVVLNSGFTYREYAYLNNARQVPKLPDWAIVDVRTPADSLWPGKIVDANFFDEKWLLKEKQ